MEFLSKSEHDTENHAKALAEKLCGSETICLYGDLGAGKTVFSRALIRALTNDLELDVPSPTFSLVQEYETPKGPLFHFDCYRLEDPQEIYELGWEDIIGQSIALIEWPSNIQTLLPAKRLDITITNVENKEHQRVITIKEVK